MASRPSFGVGAEDASTFDFRLNEADQSDLLFDVQLPGQDAAEETFFMPLYGAKTPKLPQRTLGEPRPKAFQQTNELYNSLGSSLFQRKDTASRLSLSNFAPKYTSTPNLAPHTQHPLTNSLFGRSEQANEHVQLDFQKPREDARAPEPADTPKRPDILQDLRATLTRSQKLFLPAASVIDKPAPVSRLPKSRSNNALSQSTLARSTSRPTIVDQAESSSRPPASSADTQQQSTLLERSTLARSTSARTSIDTTSSMSTMQPLRTSALYTSAASSQVLRTSRAKPHSPETSFTPLLRASQRTEQAEHNPQLAEEHVRRDSGGMETIADASQMLDASLPEEEEEENIAPLKAIRPALSFSHAAPWPTARSPSVPIEAEKESLAHHQVSAHARTSSAESQPSTARHSLNSAMKNPFRRSSVISQIGRPLPEDIQVVYKQAEVEDVGARSPSGSPPPVQNAVVEEVEDVQPIETSRQSRASAVQDLLTASTKSAAIEELERLEERRSSASMRQSLSTKNLPVKEPLKETQPKTLRLSTSLRQSLAEPPLIASSQSRLPSISAQAGESRRVSSVPATSAIQPRRISSAPPTALSRPSIATEQDEEPITQKAVPRRSSIRSRISAGSLAEEAAAAASRRNSIQPQTRARSEMPALVDQSRHPSDSTSAASTALAGSAESEIRLESISAKVIASSSKLQQGHAQPNDARRSLVRHATQDIFSPAPSETSDPSESRPRSRSGLHGFDLAQVARKNTVIASIASASTTSDPVDEIRVKEEEREVLSTHIQDGSISFGSAAEEEEQQAEIGVLDERQHQEAEVEHEQELPLQGATEDQEEDQASEQDEDLHHSEHNTSHWQPLGNVSQGWANMSKLSKSRSMTDISKDSSNRSIDDMFSRRLRDSNLHRGLDLAAEDSPGGPIQSITGFALPPGPPLVHLPATVRIPGRAVRPKAKLTEEIPVAEPKSRKRSLSASASIKAPSPVRERSRAGLTMPKEFNFSNRSRAPRLPAGASRKATEDTRPAKKARVASSAGVHAPKASTMRRIVSEPVTKRQRQASISHSAVQVPSPAREPAGLTEDALQLQERSFRHDSPHHDQMDAFLNSLHEAEGPDDFLNPQPDRDNANVLPQNLSEIQPPQLKQRAHQVELAPTLAVHQDDPEEFVPPRQKVDKGKGRAKDVPVIQPLRSKTNSAKDLSAGRQAAKSTTTVKPFTFASTNRARKEPQTNFQDKLFNWQDTEQRAATKSRPIVPIPRGRNKALAPATETQQARERVIKPVPRVEGERKRKAVEPKEFNFQTSKRKRAEA